MRIRWVLGVALLPVATGGLVACSTGGLVFDVTDAERCSNGQDDDSDGQVDCADADCGASQCVAGAPAGWIGPFALFDGDPAAAPSCPESFPVLVLSSFADLVREEAVCSACSCSPPQTLACKPDRIWISSGPGCGSIDEILEFGDDGSVCQGYGGTVGSIEPWGWDPVNTCAPPPLQTPLVGAARWGRAAVGCAAAIGGGCEAGQVCAPPPSDPFESASLCVAHPGEVACPSPDYRSRRVFHAGVNDSRSCSDCGCDISINDCAGTLFGYTNPACTNQVLSTPADYLCIDTNASHFTWTSAPASGECLSYGGAPIGCATPSDPITVCCAGEEPLCPMGMVEVPAAGGKRYCVDATEVTNAAYAGFLAASPSLEDQPPQCSWNTTYAPQYTSEEPDLPVSYVDWCDARAYCAWAGKRLCGDIDGGSIPIDSPSDATKSQWYAACSRGGTQEYSYGPEYRSGVCNDEGVFSMGPVAVGSLRCCEGGYWGLHDMIGNVLEWEDSCDGSSGPTDSCLTRGSEDFGSPPSCASAQAASRDATSSDIGFRCCSP